MKQTAYILLLFLHLLLLCTPAYSQKGTEEKCDEIKIFFDQNKYAVDLNIPQNRESLSQFVNLYNKLKSDKHTIISRIEINSYASPEGDSHLNRELSESRTNSIYDYLTATYMVPGSLILKKYSGVDWSGLQTLVERSDMPYRNEVIHIIKNVPDETWCRVKPDDKWRTMVDSRNKHLMDLQYGRPYRYMFANLYPQLRSGTVITIYFTRELQPIIGARKSAEVAKAPEQISIPPLALAPLAQSIAEPLAQSAPETIIKPLFALKTNLLFDVATLANIEVEVPIGNRWSIAGEWIFPWWTTCGGRRNGWSSAESNPRNTLEILNGNLEARYWFGDRTRKSVLTGWNVGIYAGGGLYDLEHNAKGYQGEFFLAAGVSAGYAHTINKRGNLRMEYAVGVGYLQTQYSLYQEHWGSDNTWHTIRQYNGSYSWLGPTRARVSLVWLLHHKKRGGAR